MRALAAARKMSDMTSASVGSHVLEQLDVGLDLTAQIAFNLKFRIDELADQSDLCFGQLIGPDVFVDLGFLEDLFGVGRPDPVNIPQRESNFLLCRYIDTCDSWHNKKRDKPSAMRERTKRLRQALKAIHVIKISPVSVYASDSFYR